MFVVSISELKLLVVSTSELKLAVVVMYELNRNISITPVNGAFLPDIYQ